jgi:DNA-binding NtrC family response regulator
MKAKILLIDDEAGGRSLLTGFLQKQGHTVDSFPDAESAYEAFTKRGYDIALVDVKLPGMSGIELTAKLLEIDPTLPVVLVTAFGGVDTAVAGMKAGASDYLTKPVDLEELKLIISKQIDRRRLEDENRLLKEQLDATFTEDIVAESPQMRDVLSTISRIATADAPVLITGESGVGKELIARTIHNASGRKGNFVPINCAAIPENLLESELFGAEPGAYTGAKTRMRGKIELADHGTLFLDEIGELPLSLQPKLLRFLQEGKYFRLGGHEEICPNVRVLAATNREVQKSVAEGIMREDLYFRLAVITIEIPPLRERHKDLLELSVRLVGNFAVKHRKGNIMLSKEAIDAILRHSWPGNVRELANTLERAVLLTRSDHITPEDLQMLSPTTTPKSEKLGDVERTHILNILTAVDWQMNRAADRLGIHRNTLRNKIKEYDLDKDL